MCKAKARQKNEWTESFSFTMIFGKGEVVSYAFVDKFDNFSILQNSLKGNPLTPQ